MTGRLLIKVLCPIKSIGGHPQAKLIKRQGQKLNGPTHASWEEGHEPSFTPHLVFLNSAAQWSLFSQTLTLVHHVYRHRKESKSLNNVWPLIKGSQLRAHKPIEIIISSRDINLASIKFSCIEATWL